MENLVSCKACNKEIAKGVKKCPSCGKDQRNFFAKHKIITGLAVLMLLGAISSALGGGDDTATSKPDTNVNGQTNNNQVTEAPEPTEAPTVVNTDKLFTELTANALKASKTYKGMYVELTGKLSSIDSSGDYFSLGSLEDEWSFETILCNIKDEHVDTVMEFTDGQEVTVIGTISDVGEILGYTLKVETIK